MPRFLFLLVRHVIVNAARGVPCYGPACEQVLSGVGRWGLLFCPSCIRLFASFRLRVSTPQAPNNGPTPIWLVIVKIRRREGLVNGFCGCVSEFIWKSFDSFTMPPMSCFFRDGRVGLGRNAGGDPGAQTAASWTSPISPTHSGEWRCWTVDFEPAPALMKGT
jgi:hypothetical protein